jgi:F-type H+-transporting ATPase subunit delta
MAEDRVSLRYASAVYEAAKNANSVSTVETDLATIENLLATNGDFRAFILSPNRSREEKLELVDKVFGDRVTALTLRLIKLMLEKRREEELPTIKRDFSSLKRAGEGILHVQIISAVELTAAEQKAIIEKAGAKLGKQLEADFIIDATLIGGVKLAYDDFVIDGSVRGSLDRLRESLRYDTLKQA